MPCGGDKFSDCLYFYWAHCHLLWSVHSVHAGGRDSPSGAIFREPQNLVHVTYFWLLKKKKENRRKKDDLFQKSLTRSRGKHGTSKGNAAAAAPGTTTSTTCTIRTTVSQPASQLANWEWKNEMSFCQNLKVSLKLKLMDLSLSWGEIPGRFNKISIFTFFWNAHILNTGLNLYTFNFQRYCYVHLLCY